MLIRNLNVEDFGWSLNRKITIEKLLASSHLHSHFLAKMNEVKSTLHKIAEKTNFIKEVSDQAKEDIIVMPPYTALKKSD